MSAKTNSFRRFASIFLGIALVLAILIHPRPGLAQAGTPPPPPQPVKLIFIHHSTGENWLTDGYGDLGRALAANNYFVSDTNYGWGPDSIGDRTDIPNWLEWFRSARTPVYMQALYTENGQNASYTRALGDPGGENVIVMFKSCFPNSALEGNPNDRPDPEGWLSVGHAKYVYNEILQYFATRPDKLFIVITAPPLSDGTYAKNARAFNNWLVKDWLAENNYALNNVAVFDFYNVLTDPNAHHRFKDGQVEHVYGTRNTLYYPSGDDHPSEKGSRKATEEFVPLLNMFYHRWKENAPLQPLAGTASPAAEQHQPPAAQPAPSALFDDLERGALPGTSGWEGYFQDGANTQLSCSAHSGLARSGANSLQFKFDVAANSWATCGFYFDRAQNWSAGQGITFYLRADRAGIPFHVEVYGGSPGARSTYIYSMQTSPGNESHWVLVEIPWAQFLRAEWEENPGQPFDPASATGFSLGLSTPEMERASGTLWLDDLALSGQSAPPLAENLPTAGPEPSAPQSQPEPQEPASRPGGLPCAGSLAAPLALAGVVWVSWRRNRRQ